MPKQNYYSVTVNEPTRVRLAALSVALGSSRSALTARALEALEASLSPAERAVVSNATRVLSK